VSILLAIPLVALFALVVRKARNSGWWVLLGFVPIVGLVMLGVRLLALAGRRPECGQRA